MKTSQGRRPFRHGRRCRLNEAAARRELCSPRAFQASWRSGAASLGASDFFTDRADERGRVGSCGRRLRFVRWLILVMRSLTRVAAFVAALTCSAHALADPSVTLEWRAAAGSDCPTGAEVVAEVDRILAGSSGLRRDVTARADVTKIAPGSYGVKLVTSGANTAGRRAFEAASCREIAAACALILAMAANPQLTAPAALESREETPPAVITTPVLLAADERIPVDAPARSAPVASSPKRLGASASVAGDMGALPSAAAGLELAIAFSSDRARFEVAGRRWTPSKATSTTNAGAELDLMLLGFRGGYALMKTSSLKIGPLAGLELDYTRARGFGGTTAFSPNATTIGASAGILSTWSPFAQLPSFAFRLLVEAAVPFERPRFVVREPAPAPPTDIHRAAVVAGRAALGAELLFF